MAFKAIETEYAGCRFRSRTEARWAVFFDTLSLEWEYEPEGFDLDGIRYLPDFYVQGIGWLEIKPKKEPTNEELQKCLAFAANIETMYMLFGIPQLPIVMWRKPETEHDGIIDCIRISSGSVAIMFGKVEDDNSSYSIIDPRTYCWHQRIEDGSICLWPVPSLEVVTPAEADFHVFISESDDTGLPVLMPFTRKKLDTRNLKQAYKNARSARFEFGENGIGEVL